MKEQIHIFLTEQCILGEVLASLNCLFATEADLLYSNQIIFRNEKKLER